MATITETTPPYANVGATGVRINFERMQSNLAIFGVVPPEPENAREERYEPVWQADANAIFWKRKGGSMPGLSTMALVQHVLSVLDKRSG
jgi:hypothetical protein